MFALGCFIARHPTVITWGGHCRPFGKKERQVSRGAAIAAMAAGH